MPIKEDHQVVQDLDRPDTKDKPKMWLIAEQVEKALDGMVAHIVVKCDDNIMSDVTIICSLDKKEEWPGGIYYNSRYFRFDIMPRNGQRYYQEGDKITLEMGVNGLDCKDLRKSTIMPDKAIQKMKDWIEQNR